MTDDNQSLPPGWLSKVRIPTEYCPVGSINHQLSKLPVYRIDTEHLVGVVLYLPRLKFVVVPVYQVVGSAAAMRQVASDGLNCAVLEGDDIYYQGGYNIYTSAHELQRAERVVVAEPNKSPGRGGYPYIHRDTASGKRVRVWKDQPLNLDEQQETEEPNC